MKIYYFTPYFPPEPEAAAIRSYWFHRVMVEAGHEVEVLSNDKMIFKLASSKSHSLIRLIRETVVGLELFIRVLSKKPTDMMVLSSPPYITVLFGSWACKIKKINFLLDIRDLYPEVYFDAGLLPDWGIVNSILTKLTKSMYQSSKGIISVTRGLCHSITKYQINKSKVHLITNGYDDELFFPGDPSEKNKKFTLVFHGKIGKIQNVETLINLIKRMEKYDDIQFLVIGDGSKFDDLAQLEAKNLKLINSLPYKDIPAELRKCHVGLSFRSDSRIGRDAYPVKVFEYIGTGLPVVMTPVCEMGQLLQEKGFGANFENDQLDEIVEYILNIKSNSKKIKIEASLFSRRETSKEILKVI